jgi:hypothetical protein
VFSCLTQWDAVKRVFNFFAVKDIEEARKRLDKRMQEESRYIDALTLGRVDGLEKKLTEGEQTHIGLYFHIHQIHFFLGGKASTAGVPKVPGTFCSRHRASSSVSD